MKPVEVRSELADALKLDLVGPSERLGSPHEVLPQAPSRWYLTGFLVPLDADQSQRADADSTEEVDAANDAGGTDDATTPEPASARQRYLPSSTGLSLLVPSATRKLKVKVRWGDYNRSKPDDGHGAHEEWKREQRDEELTIDVPGKTKRPGETEVRGSGGLTVALSVRPVASEGAEGGLPKERGRHPCFSSTAGNPRPTKPATKPSPSRRSSKSGAKRASSHVRTCAAWKATTGTSESPTCNIATRVSTPSGTASPPRPF